MNAMGLPGITFQAVTVSVAETAAKFPGQTIPAIRLTVTDRQAYRPGVHPAGLPRPPSADTCRLRGRRGRRTPS
jgi:hypothetical protein